MSDDIRKDLKEQFTADELRKMADAARRNIATFDLDELRWSLELAQRIAVDEDYTLGERTEICDLLLARHKELAGWTTAERALDENAEYGEAATIAYEAVSLLASEPLEPDLPF